MQPDLHERIQLILSARAASPQSELPVRFVELLGQFDSNLDQVGLFAQWEALEVQEIAVRYQTRGERRLNWFPTVDSLKEDRSEVENTEDDAEDDQEQDHASVASALGVRPWLEEIVGTEAPFTIRSADFAKWAIALRDTYSINRLNVVQTLENARAIDSPSTKELQKRQRDLEEQIVTQNLRAALFWAHRLKGDLPLPLALAAGVAGIRRAAKAFEANRGTQFLTLGTWWIRQSIGRMRTDHALPIRVPVHRMERSARMKRALGGLPFSDAQNLSTQQLLKLVNQTDGQEWELSEVEQCVLFDRTQRLSDVDSPLDLTPAIDSYFDEFCPPPIEAPLHSSTLGASTEELDALIEYIDTAFTSEKEHRTKEVVTQRLQLHGRAERLTLEELGEKFGVTRERIRQVEAKAFERISTAMKWGTD